MSFRAPLLHWPYQLETPVRAAQIVDDHQRITRYLEVTRLLDRIDFLLDGPVAVANNLWYEFSPVTESIVYEIRVHAKGAGTSLTLRYRVNGVTADTITTTVGSVVRKTPSPQQLVSPLDKISVDCTAVSGSWTEVTFTIVMEPRYV